MKVTTNEVIELTKVATVWEQAKAVPRVMTLRVSKYLAFQGIVLGAVCLLSEGWTRTWIEAKQVANQHYDLVVSQAVAMEAHRFGYRKGEVYVEPEPTTIRKIVREECVEKYGLSESLVLALIEHESAVDPTITSKAGAMGLMQVMPGTARLYGASADVMFRERPNIRVGCANLNECLGYAKGNTVQALYCYNGGPEKMKKPVAESLEHAAGVLQVIAQNKTKRTWRFDVEIDA